MSRAGTSVYLFAFVLKSFSVSAQIRGNWAAMDVRFVSSLAGGSVARLLRRKSKATRSRMTPDRNE